MATSQDDESMSFISYAQNLEDVMLYRALKKIVRGYYIDVGAQHPVNDSVTKLFYELGWCGINIEPVKKYFNLLQEDRPRDINLNVLTGAVEDECDFHEFADKGISTIREDYARSGSEAGFVSSVRKVSCTTLDTICLQHRVSVVHFLKIDVEGAEKEVLKGFSFEKVRPWIVVIEANEPNSTKNISCEWEGLILSKGYECVYYDGLNRFYLAEEHRELKVYFIAPPNVFDQYIHYSENSALPEYEKQLNVERTQKELLTRQLAEMTDDFQKVAADLQKVTADFQRVTADFQMVTGSLSWRLTVPLRIAKNGITKCLGISSVIKNLIKAILRFLLRFQLLVRLGNWILKDYPGLRIRIGSIRSQSYTRTQFSRKKSKIFEDLPESARSIYLILKDQNTKAKQKHVKINR